MNNRRYACSSKGCPDDVLTGSWQVSAYDAAKNYAGLYLPPYEIIVCRYVKVQDTEKYGLHTLWRAEFIDQAAQMGAVVWVREL